MQNTEEQNTQPQEQTANSFLAIAWKWSKRIVLTLLFLFLALSLILQIPAVQNWAAQKVSTVLSKRLDTRVEVKQLHLSFFDELALEKLFIEDLQPNDTLLFANRLYVNFDLNPVTYLFKGLVIEELELSHAQFNLRKSPAAQQSNIDIFLSRLITPDTAQQKDKKPFKMDVKILRFDEVQFLRDDHVNGQTMNAFLYEGSIRFDQFDLANKYISTEYIRLNGPYVNIKSFIGTLPPDADTTYVEADPELAESPQPLAIYIGDLKIVDGKFSLHNFRQDSVRLSPTDEIDYKHLDLYDINFHAKQFFFCQDSLDFSARVNRLSGKSINGFELENLSAKEARVWCQGMQLYDMNLKTPYSEIGDTLIFSYSTYEDWISFPDRVWIEGHINNSNVTLKDIISFAPALKYNAFFRDNAERKLKIDGYINGRINRLNGKDINIRLEDRSLVIRGAFRTRDITVRQSELVNLDLQELRTSMYTLRKLIPTFRPPDNFDRLGKLRFDGRFDGYFTDFIANGNLSSDLGKAKMNMQLSNLKEGRTAAKYNGELRLIDFDLGKWSQNPDLGKVNFYSLVDNGTGLTAESASASLTAQVDSFIYKGYRYENASLTGSLQKNLFQGDFVIADKNIDFSFNGAVDFREAIPKFNFQAAVNRLDLKRLYLSERPLVLGGNFALDIRNNALSELEGEGAIANFYIQDGQEAPSRIESINFASTFDLEGKRTFVIESDVIKAVLYGIFDIERIPAALLDYLSTHYPGFSERFGITPSMSKARPQQFTFDIALKDSKNLLSLLDPGLGTIQNGELNGYIDNVQDSIYYSLYLPQFSYNKIILNDLGVISRIGGSEGYIDLIINKPVINENELSRIKLITNLETDTINLALAYESEEMSLLDRLNLNAKIFLPDSLNYRLEFDQSNLFIMEMPWLIKKNNYITFRKGFIDTDSLQLTNNEKEIRLQTFDEQGLKLGLYNMNFDFIEDLWDYEQLDFAGRFNVIAKVSNVFNMTGITANVQADTLWINEEDWGVFRLDLDARDLKSPLHANLFITKDTSQISSKGYFNLAERRGRGKNRGDANKAQYFDFKIYATSLPMSMVEYWLKGTISQTVGHCDADLRLFGLPKAPHIDGELNVFNGATTIDFLQTRYYIDQASVKAKDFLFDASNAIIKDKYGNTATVQGGMTHKYLKQLGIAASLNTDRFLALDTKKGDNELFYGRAIGKGDITFNGPVNKIDIFVKATVGKDTRLVIPVSYGSSSSELSYIKFPSKKEKEDEQAAEDAARNKYKTGIDLEMELEITDEAVGEIIFDEQAGDIIKGMGRGNMRILVPRNGGFYMYGDYNIEQGDYLFTLYNVINKKFTVKKGGSIVWSGDPYKAQIQLEADYIGLSTSVSNFIPEYLANAPEDVQSAALIPTPVNLTMDLKGELLQPIINFDISFPELQGQLETLTDSKLRVIRQDPNELNRQVFGLIIAGQFLPSDFALQGGDIFYNTVSEFVSNQLSLLLTELFSEFFSNGGNDFSGFDFDIAYNQYQTASIQDGTDVVRGDEFQVRLKQDFFNDRLTILVGGNVDIGNSARAANPQATGTFVGNDLVIEYVLNRDRTMKLRVYQRLEPDIGGGSRLEVGTGLSFRKEYNSFGDFINKLKKDGKRLKD
jgi:hypothetical protein